MKTFAVCLVALRRGRCSSLKHVSQSLIQKLRHLEMNFRWWKGRTLSELHISELGALSRRATPTLWAKYFGQLLLLVLEALKDDDAP